jgi:U3 small nucleolar RNA-associated protein 3
MGKKRTSVFRNGADQHQNASDDDKIDAIRTWDDIEHDDEDKCMPLLFFFIYFYFNIFKHVYFLIVHEDRERVLLNDDQDDQDEEGCLLSIKLSK